MTIYQARYMPLFRNLANKKIAIKQINPMFSL